MKDNVSKLLIYSTLTKEAEAVKDGMRPLVDEIMQRLKDTGAPEEALPAGILILISALAEEAIGRQLLTPGEGITVRHGTADSLPQPAKRTRRRTKAHRARKKR